MFRRFPFGKFALLFALNPWCDLRNCTVIDILIIISLHNFTAHGSFIHRPFLPILQLSFPLIPHRRNFDNPNGSVCALVLMFCLNFAYTSNPKPIGENGQFGLGNLELKKNTRTTPETLLTCPHCQTVHTRMKGEPVG